LKSPACSGVSITLPAALQIRITASCDRLREIIADNLSKAGWSWGCVSAVDSEGQTIFVADAHRDDGKRFVVRADEKLSAFVELERISRESGWHILSE
jgi:hypothetical protein